MVTPSPPANPVTREVHVASHSGATAPSRPTAAAAPSIGRRMLNRVPEVTIFFWIIKILATTVGETFADYLNENLGWA